MNPLLKWILTAVAALLLLVGGATVALRVLVDEERLEATLVELVNGNVDATLAIDGGVKLSLWPTLALAADGVRLRTPAGAGEDFATARRLRLGVALLPLLRNELQVHELRLAGLRLAADCDRSGRCNWAALGGTGANSSTAAGTSAGDAAAAPLALGIERIHIDDAELGYRDERDGTHVEVTGLTLTGDDINSHGEPFRLRGEATIRSGTPAREFVLNVQTAAKMDGQAHTVALSDALLRLIPAGAPALELKLPAALLDLDASTLKAAQLGLSGTGLDASASLDAGWGTQQGARARGKLELQRLDLPALLGALGSSLPPTVNAAALTKVTLSADYAYDSASLALDTLALTAGEFHANGRVRLGLGEKLRVDATLDSPQLDVDYFLPPAEPTAAKQAKSAADSGDGDLSGVGALLAIDGSIEARIGHLKRAPLELDTLQARLALGPGKARLERLQAGLYGGKLDANGELVAQDAGARMNVAATLAGVDLERLLAQTADTHRFSGRVDGSLKFAANGASTAALLASLAGPLELTIADPVIKDLSVEETICKAAATINRESLSAHFEPVTRLQSVRTTLDFHDGVGQFRELGLLLPNMRMNGQGSVDLPRQRLDVHLDVRVTNDLAERDPACRMSRKMLAIDWPLRCAGSFDEEPKKWCGIDQDGIAKIAGQIATEKVREKVEDKLRDKLKGKLGNFLNRD
jgi:AsmA protein